MTGKSAGPGECPDKAVKTRRIVGKVWIIILQTAFQIEICQIGRGAVTRSGYQEDVPLLLQDEAVQTGVEKIDPRTGSPMAEEAVFDVGRLKRLPQQDILLQVDLRRGQVVGRPEIAFI